MLLFKKAVLSLALCAPLLLRAQTDRDAIMMNRHQLCQALIYQQSSWDHYWEGTFRRSNANLGTVTTRTYIYMPNYGITNRLNLMASVPYVRTKASAGTLHGMEGLQDLMVLLKWKAYTTELGKSRLSLFLLGGFSTPLSGYTADFLPMSIGLGSTNLLARGMADYRRGRFTVTGSAAYIRRSNVRLDRDAYYDTELHLTSEVRMPNAAEFQLRTGYRGRYLIAEALLTQMNTLGGFDITKNNMPFPSNRMNATVAGAEIKYSLPPLPNLSLYGGGHLTLVGRNMGQSRAFEAGLLYAFYTSKHHPSSSSQTRGQ